MLQQLMSDKNTIQIRYLKMFFIGPPRVGKTLTRLRLCNEMKNIISRGDTALPDSTLLANCKQILMYISSENGQNTWMTSSNLKEEAQILFQYMCMVDRRSDVPPSTSSGSELVNAPDVRTVQHTPTHIEKSSLLKKIVETATKIVQYISSMNKRRSTTAHMPNLDSDIKLQAEKDSTPENRLQEYLQYDDIMSTFESLIQTGSNSKLENINHA